MYKGEVIHFIGGLTEYIGQLEMSEHLNGKGWYRLNDPCVLVHEKKGEEVRTRISRLGGPKRVYRRFVDIFIPDAYPMEIRVLDKNNELYNVYFEAVNQVVPDRIVLPNLSLVDRPN